MLVSANPPIPSFGRFRGKSYIPMVRRSLFPTRTTNSQKRREREREERVLTTSDLASVLPVLQGYLGLLPMACRVGTNKHQKEKSYKRDSVVNSNFASDLMWSPLFLTIVVERYFLRDKSKSNNQSFTTTTPSQHPILSGILCQSLPWEYTHFPCHLFRYKARETIIPSY